MECGLKYSYLYYVFYPSVVSDISGNNFINIGNIEKYFIECCSEGPNNPCFLNLSIQLWAGFDEQIQEKLTYYEMGLIDDLCCCRCQ